ncbi:MAG: MFS transporter [Microbacterium sp.]
MRAETQALGRAHWLIGAVAFSKIGALSYTVVMTWAVSQVAGNESVGWINAAAGAATVLVGFFATFWLDRFDRRLLLLLFDAVSAVVCLIAAAIAALAPAGGVVLIALAIAVTTSSVASLYAPTSRALIPSVVPPEGLERFNSVYTGFGEISRATGPALGTLLLAAGGADAFPLSLLANAVSFLLSLWFTLRLPSAPSRRRDEESKKSALFVGLRYITGHPGLRGEVIGALGINFFLTSTTFVLLNRISETGSEGYVFGLANLFEALGAVTAAVTAAFTASHLRGARASQLMMPIAIVLLLCLIDGIWPTIVSLTLMAALVTIYNVVLFSRLQREIPPDKMGRVIAVVTTGSAALMPVGNLVFANLSTALTSVALVWITSAGLAIAGVIAGFSTSCDIA